VSVLCQFRVCS